MKTGVRVLAAFAAVALLAGCSSGSGDDSGEGGSNASPGVAATALPPGGVLVEQTIDTPSQAGETSHGGTMTVTVRSVVVSDGMTVLSWAVRWDDSGAEDGTSVPLADFFKVGGPPVLIDGEALKYYYPLCDNDWASAVGRSQCSYEALFSPQWNSSPKLANHQTLEAWAVYPELGRDTTMVNLGMPEGLPAFSGLPVTRS
jgi:hypothetical protein